MSPASFRDSGMSASPVPRLRRGLRPKRSPVDSSTLPDSSLLAPKSASASSVRPAPTRPAMPRISPARRSNDTPLTPGADTSRTDMRTGASASSRTCFSGNVAVSERPSIASTSEDSVSSAVEEVRTSRPSRRTVTESASSSTSRRKCEMRRIVFPLRASERTISWSASVSFAASAAVGSSMTMSCASRESARRISNFCWSAVRSAPAGAPPGRSNPADAASSSYAWRSWRPRTKPVLRGSSPRRTFSATVSCGTTDGSCAIAATLCSSASRGERNETASPPSSTRPESGDSAPATMRPSVDFPAPFSPTRA